MSLQTSRSLALTLIYRAGLVSLLSLYVFILMEWLFFATKTSFLDSYPLAERVLSLLSTPLLFAPFVFGLFLVCAILFYILLAGLNIRLLTLLAIVPATIVTTLTLLLADNFSNTVLGVGIRDTNRTTAVAVLIAIACIWLMWRAWVLGKVTQGVSFILGFAVALSGISILSLTTMFLLSDDLESSELSRTGQANLPNIIFFAADGIQASHMSAYGYHRKTTPNLDELSKDSLLAFNAVSNSGRTTGATTALLTGKYPTTTKVIFPPHVLRERHMFQHLPGLLKELGYQNVQESVRYFADAIDLNMRGAFDFANGRLIPQETGIVPGEVRYKLFPAFVLARKITERLVSRIQHLLGVRIIEKVSEAVDPANVAKVYGTPDKERVESVIRFIKKAEKPVFAHIHLMDTHCCNHRPDVKVFSRGKKINRKNYADFYDDIILETDSLFGQFIDSLKAMGEYENSLIVYSSDHTRGWHTNKSVPLIIKFPGNAFKGERYGAHQLVDVAPTIVDYLKFSIPEWMEGISLISSDESSERDIYAVDSIEKKDVVKKNQLSTLSGSGPPLFGVKVVNLVACGQNYYLNIQNGDFQKRQFVTQGEGCSSPVDEVLVRTKLENHLLERGFSIPYLSVSE